MNRDSAASSGGKRSIGLIWTFTGLSRRLASYSIVLRGPANPVRLGPQKYLSYSCKIFLRSESNGVGRAAEHYAIACKTPGEASERPNQPHRPLTAGTRRRIAVHQSRAVVARLQRPPHGRGRQSHPSAPVAAALPVALGQQ